MPDTLTGPSLAYHERIVALVTEAQQAHAATSAKLREAQQLANGWAAVVAAQFDMGPKDTIQADGRIVRAPKLAAVPQQNEKAGA